MKYTLEAGRLVVVDGKPLLTMNGKAPYDPCEADAFAREAVAAMNVATDDAAKDAALAARVAASDAKKMDGAMSQAKAQFESIREMVEALRIAGDDDAFEDAAEDLAKAAGYSLYELEGGEEWRWCAADGLEGGGSYGRMGEDSYGSEEEAWRAACEDNDLRPKEEDARQAIEEDALSVQVRSGWYSPGDKKSAEAEEYEILLCTGGPAVRIRGQLSQYSTPESAAIECQDWFTPWVKWRGEEFDEGVVLEYARCFWFGECGLDSC